MPSTVTSQNFNWASKDQILEAVDDLSTRFSELKNCFDKMSSADQVEHINNFNKPYAGCELREIAIILNGLQDRVSASPRKDWGAIPDISDDELDTISVKLKISANLLSSIRENCQFAHDVCVLAETCELIFKDKDPSKVDPKEVKPLKNRVTQLELRIKDSRNPINQNNTTALQQVKKIIETATNFSHVNLPLLRLIHSPRPPDFATRVVPIPSINSDDLISVVNSQPDFPIDPESQKILEMIATIEASTRISYESKQAFYKQVVAIVSATLSESSFPSSQPSIPSSQPSIPSSQPTIVEKKIDVEKKINPIEELQGLLPLLSGSASPKDLELAIAKLATLKSKDVKLPFKISSGTPQNVVERIYFHLYFIHKKETPRKLKNDPNYGSKAMTGEYPASNNERMRAIQRTIAEIALHNLEEAINTEGLRDDKIALIILEGLQMSTDDTPREQNNLVYALFKLMYDLHREARKHNPLLINPDDSRFKGDFGRNAFFHAHGINPKTKIDAINALRKDLKAVWSV